MRIILLLILGLSLVACDQKGSTDSTKNRARAEEEANSEVQRKILKEKAEKMEVDLALRHNYYQAMAGKYQGNLQAGKDTLRIRITLAPSLPPYTGARVRELSEIESDLNNLYFHAQIVQWHPDSQTSAVGCRISGLRPNMEMGLLTIASADCPNLYVVNLGDSQSGKDEKSIQDRAAVISQQVFNQELDQVEKLVGSVQPSSSAAIYTFDATRTTSDKAPAPKAGK